MDLARSHVERVLSVADNAASTDGEPRIATSWRRCLVHHNRLSSRSLILYHPIVVYGNAPPPYLIGRGDKKVLNAIPLPKVRLKMVLVHSYYTPPGP